MDVFKPWSPDPEPGVRYPCHLYFTERAVIDGRNPGNRVDRRLSGRADSRDRGVVDTCRDDAGFLRRADAIDLYADLGLERRQRIDALLDHQARDPRPVGSVGGQSCPTPFRFDACDTSSRRTPPAFSPAPTLASLPPPSPPVHAAPKPTAPTVRPMAPAK